MGNRIKFEILFFFLKDYHKSHNNCLLTNQISLKYLHLIWSQMEFYKSTLIYLKFLKNIPLLSSRKLKKFIISTTDTFLLTMHNDILHFWIWCRMPHSNGENNFNLWPSPLAWWEIHWHHYRFQLSMGKYPLEGSLISALTLEKNAPNVPLFFQYPWFSWIFNINFSSLKSISKQVKSPLPKITVASQRPFMTWSKDIA